MRQRFLIVFILSAWVLGQIWIPAPLKAQTVIASSWRPDTPLARQGHALAAGDGAVFLFGGETDDSELRLLNDLWVWRDGVWQWLASNGPSPRSWAALAYDEQRHELILFGGWNGLSELNDTWVWRDGQWSRRTPAQSPPARRRHTMAYHPPSGQIVLFGGSAGTLLGDTWVWNGETWTNLTTLSGPSARRSHAMAYDAPTGQIVLFGGRDATGARADTWVWNGAAWSQQTPAQPPPARFNHSLISWPAGVVLFGGEDGPNLFNDTWQWDGSAWRNLLPPAAPPIRSAAAAAYSAERSEALLFGGGGLIRLYSDTWAWDGRQWRALPTLPAPPMRAKAALVDDVGRGVAVLFGGIANDTPLGDTWIWSADAGWRRALPATSPPPRFGHAMAYDPIRDEIVLFGGFNQQSRDDTWVWNGETWTQRIPPVSPPPRWGHTMTFDAARGRIVLFGGAMQASGFYQDTWEWDGTNWVELRPQTSPPPRRNHAAAYDTARSRLVIFGGYAFNGTQAVYYNDTWEWDGTNWQQRTAPLTPQGRSEHALVYDAALQQTVLIGGRNGAITERSVWAWDGATWTEQTDTPRLPSMMAPLAVYQVAACRTIIVGPTAEYGYGRLNTWQRSVSPCIAAPTARIDSIAPNPANRSTDQIILIGSGAGAPGSGRTITAYRWMLNGRLIGTEAEIRLATHELAIGVYRITFAVRDNAGLWSAPVEQLLTIIDHPRLVVDTTEVRATLSSGSKTERQLLITNTGGSPLTVELSIDFRAVPPSSTTAAPAAHSVTAPLVIPRLQAPAQRLDPRLSDFANTATASPHQTYLVLLNEIADLRAAERITDWRERGRYVVQQLQAVANQTQASILAFLAEQQRTGNVSEYWPLYSINAIIVRGDAETLRALLALPQIVGITISEVYRLNDAPAAGRGTILPQTTAVRWNIARIGADRVWDEFNTRGEGVVVGVIDTGAYLHHPLLSANYRGLNPDGSVDHSWSWFDPTYRNKPAPDDTNGHGTHVLGAIAGAGGIGVAPGARWIAARGCSDRECRDSDLLRAMEWMLAPYPAADGPAAANPDLRPRVVNNSWGAAGGNPLFQQMVAVWRAADIFPVFAAGNCGAPRQGCTIAGVGSISSPADYSDSFAVGATDKDDRLAAFSSQGPSRLTTRTKPDLVAPGAEIESAWINGQTRQLNGTSMASPHVAGAAALLRALRPGLAIDQIETLLRSTARDLGEPGPDSQTGFGLLDVYAAAQAAIHGWRWAILSQTTAVIAPGQSQRFTIRLDGRGLAAGQYNATLIMFSNDPNRAELRIPLHLLVQTTLQRPSAPLFTHITATGFIARWRAPDGNIAAIEYATSSDGPWTRQIGRESVIPGETVFALQRLAPRTTYLLRFISTNGAIDDNEGRMYRVTTAAPLPFPIDEPSTNVRVYLPLILK